MKKQLIATAITAITAAAIGFTAVAQADAELYGSIRAGVVSSDDDGANSGNRLDLGATENDGTIGGQGLYSRIGFKGSTDLGNGASAGFKVERQVGKDALTTRHTNVYVGGSWGKLTLGQQDNPYRNARHWDQTWFLGGQNSTDGGSRIEGLNYALSSGAFSLNIMAVANDTNIDTADGSFSTSAIQTITVEGTDAVTAEDAVAGVVGVTGVAGVGSIGDADYVAAVTAVTHVDTVVAVDAVIGISDVVVTGRGPSLHDTDDDDSTPDVAVPEISGDDGIDGWVIQAAYDFGPVVLNFAHQTNSKEVSLPALSGLQAISGGVAAADDTADKTAATRAAAITEINNTVTGAVDANATRDTTAFGLNGSAGSLDWYVAYQASELNTDNYENDVDSFGGFLGYNLNEKNTLYAYHVAHSADRSTYDAAGAVKRGEDYTETILGYSRKMGPDMTFIAEYLTLDHDTDAVGSDPSVLALALKYDF